MEDALVPGMVIVPASETLRLNPCFNGRCTRTRQDFRKTEGGAQVLILVLMEDALVRCEP